MKLAEICRQRALDTDKEKVRETLMRAAIELESAERELAEARELLRECESWFVKFDQSPLLHNEQIPWRIRAFLARAKD